jgi:hypothetical protein
MNKWESIAEMAKGEKTENKFIAGYFFIDKNGIFKNSNTFDTWNINNLPLDGWKIYEEKPELKKDPLLGKQLVQKSDTKLKYIITGKIKGGYVIDNTNYDKDSIKDLFYIEGEDF